MTAKDHVDKVGIAGAAFAALCCLGTPALLSVLTAIGLGFLIHDAILIPLLILFLIVTLWGLGTGRRRHGRPAPLILGGVGATAVLLFSVVMPSRTLALAGIVALVAASVTNVLFLRAKR
jgi:mercuric ion transport protein